MYSFVSVEVKVEKALLLFASIEYPIHIVCFSFSVFIYVITKKMHTVSRLAFTEISWEPLFYFFDLMVQRYVTIVGISAENEVLGNIYTIFNEKIGNIPPPVCNSKIDVCRFSSKLSYWKISIMLTVSYHINIKLQLI